MKNRYHYIGCFIEKSELERRLGSVETRPLSPDHTGAACHVCV